MDFEEMLTKRRKVCTDSELVNKRCVHEERKEVLKMWKIWVCICKKSKKTVWIDNKISNQKDIWENLWFFPYINYFNLWFFSEKVKNFYDWIFFEKMCDFPIKNSDF